jgi:diguanylate cyclase (GGDEF)-like protein
MRLERPRQSKIARRFAPFAAVGFLALLMPLLPPRPEDWTPVVVAAVLTAVIAATAVLVPWSRLPRWTYIVPPLTYFVVVAVLRQANDGSVSGYAPLAPPPSRLDRLNLGRREVAIGIGVGAAVLVLPSWSAIPSSTRPATATGNPVDGGRHDRWLLRRVARARDAHADPYARDQERTIAAVAAVTRALTKEVDARADICRATLEIADATFAAIWEPDASGDLVLTGHAGTELARSRFHTAGDASGTVRAFTTGSRYLAADAVSDAAVAQDEVERTGVVDASSSRSCRNMRRSVSCVGWDRRVEVDEQTAQAVTLLAVEGAFALVRADLLAGLSEMAETDELTGLPTGGPGTRRSDAPLATPPGRTALSVILVDIDHFKAYNDEHGHQAGDRLLKTAAAAWRTALRRSDVLARYGGKEFAIVLPSCPATEAAALLERLRLLTPEEQTCSIGLAESARGSRTPSSWHGDEALYQAKHSGRDVSFSPSRSGVEHEDRARPVASRRSSASDPRLRRRDTAAG